MFKYAVFGLQKFQLVQNILVRSLTETNTKQTAGSQCGVQAGKVFARGRGEPIAKQLQLALFLVRSL